MARTTSEVTLTAFGHAPRSGEAEWQSQSFAVRVGRAAWAWIAMWATACVAVFLPFQITSVPRLFAGGIVLARFHLAERRRLRAIRGVCPRCETAHRFTPGLMFPIELRLHCTHCHHAVFVQE